MSKWRVIILAVAFVAVLGGLIWWALSTRPPNPVYAGHPLSYWLTQPAYTDASGVSQLPLIRSSLDSNAVPFLVQALKTRDATLQLAYDHLWPQFPAWLKWLVPNPSSEVLARRVCCVLLGSLGTVARSATPDLVRVLRKDDDIVARASAAFALGRVADEDDKPIVEALLAATKDKEVYVRSIAGIALWRLNPEAAAKTGIPNPAARTSPANNSAGAVR